MAGVSSLKASPKAYKKMSEAGIKHVRENYNFDTFEKQWIDLIDKVVKEKGSWETRKEYSTWSIKEVA